AIRVLYKSTENDPSRSDSFLSLGQLFERHGRVEGAADAYRRSIENDPQNWISYHVLGMVLNMLGRVDEAVAIWKRWIAGEPEHPVPRHLLAAGLGENVPARAQDDYVRNSFDSFSASFDRQLERLKYRAPELVAEALQKAHGGQAAGLDILDAGCGTGLCGPLLRSSAKTL